MAQQKISKRAKGFIGILFTLIVLGMFLLPNLAQAVSVLMQADKSTYGFVDQTVTFDMSIDIDDYERVPLQHLTLAIAGPDEYVKHCKFTLSGKPLDGCSDVDITLNSAYRYGQNGPGYGYENGRTLYGYGYQGLGYGYVQDFSLPWYLREGYGYGYFNYGYGYGYAPETDYAYNTWFTQGGEPHPGARSRGDFFSDSLVFVEGETLTAELGDTEYEIKLLIVSDNDGAMKFVIDGVLTPELFDGDSFTLPDGAELIILDVIPNEGGEEEGGDEVLVYLYRVDEPTEFYGYGYGYGYTNFADYGYGYGYGYGLEGWNGELQYTVVWNATGSEAPDGDYEANLKAYAHDDGEYTGGFNGRQFFFLDDGRGEFIYMMKNPVTFSIDRSIGDYDRDGIHDPIDPLIGNSPDVETNSVGLTVFVGGNQFLGQDFEGVHEVTVTTADGQVLKFDYDFDGDVDGKKLDLRDIEIIIQNINTGSIEIHGLDVNAGTKTVRVKRPNDFANGVCVKDAEGARVSSMTSTCSAPDEFQVVCDGTIQHDQYRCVSVEGGSFWEVAGLDNSAVRQQNFATGASTPTTGGGGGGGGSAFSTSSLYTWQNLAEGETVELDIESGIKMITQVRFTPANPLQDAGVNILNLYALPEGASTPQGELYRFGEVRMINMDNDDLRGTRVRFRVDRAWIDDNEYDPSDIVLLQRFGGQWRPMTTSSRNYDNDYYHFLSPTEGFGQYAVVYLPTQEASAAAAEEAGESVVETTTTSGSSEGGTSSDGETTSGEGEENDAGNSITGLAVGDDGEANLSRWWIGLLIPLGLFFAYHRRKKKKK